MRRISLSQGKYAIVDDEDYEMISRFKWHYSKRGYAYCILNMGRLNGKSQWARSYLHRMILHVPLDKEIDHCNHNKLDCRRANMRVCTRQQNSRNMLRHRDSVSIYKGVSWSKEKGKWESRIYNNKSIFLGYFNDETEAAKIYNTKASELFGEFACLNEVA